MAAPASIKDAMTDRIMLGTPLDFGVRWGFHDLRPRTIAKTCSYKAIGLPHVAKIRDGYVTLPVPTWRKYGSPDPMFSRTSRWPRQVRAQARHRVRSCR